MEIIFSLEIKLNQKSARIFNLIHKGLSLTFEVICHQGLLMESQARSNQWDRESERTVDCISIMMFGPSSGPGRTRPEFLIARSSAETSGGNFHPTVRGEWASMKEQEKSRKHFFNSAELRLEGICIYCWKEICEIKIWSY